MRSCRRFTFAMLGVALLLGGAAGCSDDSPTADNAPMISQLRVDGAIRATGDAGLVGIRFDYVDPDRDVRSFVFALEGGGAATNSLSDATGNTGTVSVQQTVTLPPAGTEVTFSVFVLDGRGNRSNTLTGTFVAP